MKLQFIKLVTVFGILLLSISTFAQTTEVDNQPSEQRADRPQDRNKRPPRGERPTFSKILKDLDRNKDGKLSKKEAKGPLKKDFAKVDQNKDGFISKAEFQKMPPPPPRKRRD